MGKYVCRIEVNTHFTEIIEIIQGINEEKFREIAESFIRVFKCYNFSHYALRSICILIAGRLENIDAA